MPFAAATVPERPPRPIPFSPFAPGQEPLLSELARRGPDLLYRLRLHPVRGYEYVSPAAQEMLGYSPEAFYADPELGVRILHPEDRAKLEALQGDPRGVERATRVRAFRADGTTVWLDQRAVLVHDERGVPVAVEAIVRDVTHEELARQALELPNHILLRLPEAVAVVRAEDGVFLHTNPHWDRLFGYDAGELLGLTLDEVHPAEPSGAAGTRARLERQLAEMPTAEYEIQNVRKDGTRFWSLVRAAPFDDPDNGAVWIMTHQDVTDARRARQSLRSRSRELARINRELEQFVAFASHDLREPLHVLLGYLERLERRYKGRDAEFDPLWNRAVDGARRMSDLIKALLSYARLGRAPPDRHPTDLNVLVEETLDNLRWDIDATRARVTYDRLPTVPADRRLLLQVLQNLISNAIKFRAPRRAPRVHVFSLQEPDRWLFGVRDNGIGIPVESRERIFNAFQRLHTEEEYPGAGIGLAICKKVLELHSGTLWVDSELGQGSTFYFSLPLQPTEPAPAPEEEDA
jgi:PAS domain S-box-containing protein